jgi:hypothetical protein
MTNLLEIPDIRMTGKPSQQLPHKKDLKSPIDSLHTDF